MKERGLWRFWSTFLLLLAGNLCNSVVHSQSHDGARGDSGDGTSALGFSGIVQRHDGYVKGETPTIPQTSFSCSAQPYNPGLYADVETQCQVYHVCFEDRQESFLCGPGTNFNQRILACDFWYNFDCQDSPNFYSANADIGKVPQTVFRPGQSRDPQKPQQPSYPSFPQQPAQPPSVGSYPPSVRVPPPPSRPSQPPRTPQEPIEPQPPRVSVQPPRIPDPPAFRPDPPAFRPDPPAFRPDPPAFRPDPPAFRPDPPAFRPDPPAFRPDPPAFRPDPPAFRPDPPAFRPDPPRVYPEPPKVNLPPPAPRPQHRPDPPQVSVQPQYPRVPQGSGQPSKVRPPPSQQLPPTQQEEDNGYQFDGYNPSRPVVLPPQPPRHQTPRPVVFPPVVSPPRVTHPPLTPAVIRQPEIPRRPYTPPVVRQPDVSRPRPPAFETRPEFHPDAHLKGGSDYRPPQPSRVPQPSQPVGSGYPSYPVPQRPVAQRPIPQRPVAQRPIPQRPVAQRPIEKPSRPAYQPPQTVQQEHVDTEYVPPPPPPQPKEPSRPSTSYVPPPPPPPPRVQQEVTNVGFTKPPQKPSRPVYVPPPVVQKPVDNDYGRPQPPVSPSIIREQQKPVAPPPSRPQVSVGSRQPQRPKPVFPPASDHPNANIKGGPGYQQPPPQIPKFEPTRISRPSSPHGGYQPPPQPTRPRPVSTGTTSTTVKHTGNKTPSGSGQGAYKPPQQDRVKKPSDPPRTVYQPPIQVIDHPRADIKGVAYDPKPVQRVQSPSTSVVGIKQPQATGGYKQPTQRPRAPVVVSRPHPPSLPTTSVKKTSPVDSQVYDKPRPQPPAPSRVKQPSTSHVQTVSRPSQPRFPTHEVIDHPNANVKGGPSYQPAQQPISVPRPSGPPSSPSTSYEQKTVSTNQGRGSGTGYPSYPSRGDGGSIQQVIQQQDYKPIRTSPPSSIKTVQKVTAVKDTSSYPRPPAGSQHSVLINKQSKPDYEAGSSYTRGPETYPKPEFGKPHTPVSTPSRLSPNTKQGSPSQNTITRSQNKPSSSGPSGTSVSVGSGGSDIRPDYPFGQVPGHQPPHQRQVFPHRENPDHPNESLKGSGAYRPPPPAGFQAAASEIQEQKVVPEPEPAASLHGDTGSE